MTSINLFSCVILLTFTCFVQSRGILTADKRTTQRGNRFVKSCPIEEMFRPENGNMAVINGKVGTNADFNCLDGFVLVGQAISTCLPNGKWSSKTPWCRPICEYTTCMEGTKCQYDYKEKSAVCICKSSFDCPLAYEPVCGNDGRTFTSNCTLSASSCQHGSNEIQFESNGKCLQDHSMDCPMCPQMKTCPAFYASKFAFIGKITRRSKSSESSFEDVHIYVDEVFKGYAYIKAQQRTTMKLKLRDNRCACVPEIPKGRVLVMGQTIMKAESGLEVPLIDELTIVEKYYSPKQMSLCWLY